VPEHVAPVVGSVSAMADATTADAYLRVEHRSRLLLRLVGGAAMVAWGLAWLADRAGAGHLAGVLAVAGALLVVAVVLVIATQPVRAHDVRTLRRALGCPWRRVEIVSMAGAPADPTRRVVILLDPRTGEPTGTWLVAMIRTPSWLDVDERQWAYLAVEADGTTAVLAPLDRSSFAILRTRAGLGSQAVHEWAWNAANDRWVFEPPAEPGSAAEGSDLGVRVEPGEPRRWPNRPLTTRGQVVVVGSLVALAALLTATGIATERSDAHHAAGLLEDGTRTTAVVVSSSDGGGRNPAQIEVKYDTGDGWTYQVRFSVARDQLPPEGAVVRIAYDPADPADPVLVDIDEASDLALAFVAWAAVVAVGGRFAWRALRRRSSTTAPE
jgi:hypothetical protein